MTTRTTTMTRIMTTTRYDRSLFPCLSLENPFFTNRVPVTTVTFHEISETPANLHIAVMHSIQLQIVTGQDIVCMVLFDKNILYATDNVDLLKKRSFF